MTTQPPARRAGKLFVAAFAANVALALASLALQPARVAIHFGPDGRADNWASNTTNALLMLGLHVFLFCTLYFAHHLARVCPARWVSLPNKAYWLSPAQQPQALLMLREHLRQIGAAMFLLLFVMGLLTLQANRSDPVRLDMRLSVAALIAFLGYTIWWLVAVYRAFRLPAAG